MNNGVTLEPSIDAARIGLNNDMSLTLPFERLARVVRFFMSDRVAEITREVLSFSVADRIEIAQELWQSLHDLDSDKAADKDLLEEIRRRNAELSTGTVRGRTHQEVMESMRRAIECK